VEDWLRRARRGPGVVGRLDSATAYFWGERSWGGPLIGSCYRQREEGGGNGGNNKNKKKDKPPKPTAPPPPTPAPTG
jgi:hypothetical protein